MRLLCTVGLLAAVGLAATSPQAAAEAVEVVNERTGEHCTTSTCSFHATSTDTRIYILNATTLEATCNSEVMLDIGEAGGGAISDLEVFTGSGSDANCATVSPPCSLPWDVVSPMEEVGAGVSQITVDACIQTEVGTCSGNLLLAVTETGDERYALSTQGTKRIGSSLCYVNATWQGEDNHVHINHAPHDPGFVEVVKEATGVHCTTPTCGVHVASVGNVELEAEFFGIHVLEATCNVEFTLSFDEQGRGTMSAFSSSSGTGSDPNCGTLLTACDSPWDMPEARSEDAAALTGFDLRMCIDSGEGAICRGEVSFTLQETAGEALDLSSSNSSIHSTSDNHFSACYLTADWQVEAGHGLHINHL